MSLILDYFTSGTQPITSWSFWFGIPALFNFKGVETGSYSLFVIAFRYLESFTKSKYVSKCNPFLMFLYNSNLGNLLRFCIPDHQCSTKKLFSLFLTSLMTTVRSSMSKLYFSALTLTLLTQVRKPWLWRLYSAMNTFLTIVFSGMPTTRR